MRVTTSISRDVELPGEVIGVVERDGHYEFRIKNVAGWRHAAQTARAVMLILGIQGGVFTFVSSHYIGIPDGDEEDVGSYYTLVATLPPGESLTYAA